VLDFEEKGRPWTPFFRKKRKIFVEPSEPSEPSSFLVF
jgi:hypothetical protein